MKSYYASAFVRGDNILETGYENGERFVRKVPYEPTLFYKSSQPSKYKDIHGNNCTPFKFPTIKAAKQAKDAALGISNREVLGFDKFHLAYLSDTYPDELPLTTSDFRFAVVDIEVYSPNEFPEPSAADHPIDAVTHYDYKDDTFYVFSTRPWDRAKSILDSSILSRVKYREFMTEKELLCAYINFWSHKFPDAISGWHSKWFDELYIYNRMVKIIGKPLANTLSPHGIVNKRSGKDDWGNEQEYVDITGVASLDCKELYKKFTFVKRPRYDLDYIAEVELGRSKLKYEGPIHKLSSDNPQLYIDYNIVDVDIVVGLDAKRAFFDQAVAVAYDNKITLDMVFGSVVVWDANLFNRLRKKNIVVPGIRKVRKEGKFKGAFVKDPKPGRYNWVMSFDLTSLYPMLLIQYNISPETFIGRVTGVHDIISYIEKTIDIQGYVDSGYAVSGSGAYYSKETRGVIPEAALAAFTERKEAKDKSLKSANMELLCIKILGAEPTGAQPLDVTINDSLLKYTEDTIKAMSKGEIVALYWSYKKMKTRYETLQLAKKVMLNSLYGCLGNVFFRYFDLTNAEAVTYSGQLANRWIERKFNEYLNKISGTTGHDYIIAMDTDSNYLDLNNLFKERIEGKISPDRYTDAMDHFGSALVEPFIKESYAELAEYTGAMEVRTTMDREAIASVAFWTAKKRYAMWVLDMEGVRKSGAKIIGLESKKSSTPEFCRPILGEGIKVLLTEDESGIQKFIETARVGFDSADYRDIARNTGVSDMDKWIVNGRCISRTPMQVRASHAFNSIIDEYRGDDLVEPITNGSKVSYLHLYPNNPIGSPCIAFPAEYGLPTLLRDAIVPYINKDEQFEKSFMKPMRAMTELNGWNPVDTINIEDWM